LARKVRRQEQEEIQKQLDEDQKDFDLDTEELNSYFEHEEEW
jgi:uncharacterized membrane-anchored protein YhcB (DUF1043 family)